MSRILLTYVLPLALPTLAYLIWLWWAGRRKKARGGEPASLRDGPWFWLILTGFILMASSLVYVALTGGDKPGGTYQPPRYEGGKVIPGQVK